MVTAERTRLRRRFEVHGVVQGVGFRPFVYVNAVHLGLAGSVRNSAAGVVVEVEGEVEAVDEFARRLRRDPPPLAVVESVRQVEVPCLGGTGFAIEETAGGNRVRTLAAPDVATCVECLEEIRDPVNRRFRHPFVTCTNCGPRFTIITGLPYDRPSTTMADFAMCDDCEREYVDPSDRRFHAQPISCPRCGPELTFWPDAASAAAGRGESALQAARRLLAAGGILAVKGVGGYHLACDARNHQAVVELRRRKRRGDKPFAIMAADLDVVRRLVRTTQHEKDLLTDTRRPIVLLPRRAHPTGDGSVSTAVAPGSPDLGVMLPYTALHTLLFGLEGDQAGPDVLVMTSGNLSGEPIVTDDAEARTRLAAVADAWLGHDRRIHVPCDDSVTRVVGSLELPVRRSRGYAPLPLVLPFPVGPTLAVGADLKNTCALAAGSHAWASQHIGDMDDLSTYETLTEVERHLELITGVEPARLVADMHPGYRSTRWAREHAQGRPVVEVQHHHAHIAAVMGEHRLAVGDRVIGVAFDGTGYGVDGAVWGGEVLLAGYPDFRRAAHLGYVPLPGGDASVLRPYRMALAHLYAAGVAWDDDLAPVRHCPTTERSVLAHQLHSGLGTVPTSSMGRLFDAVASLVGVRQEVDYEAQAAIELEGLAREVPVPASGYRFGIMTEPAGNSLVADQGPVVRAVVADTRTGVPRRQVAARFHAGVAQLVEDLAVACRRRTGLDVVALGGGVFQNAVLLTAAEDRLHARGFTVLRPRLLPPNDAAIAFGQLLVAGSRRPVGEREA